MTQRILTLALAIWFVAAPAVCSASCGLVSTDPIQQASDTDETTQAQREPSMPHCHRMMETEGMEDRSPHESAPAADVIAVDGPSEIPALPDARDRMPNSRMCCSGDEEPLLLSQKLELPNIVWTFVATFLVVPEPPRELRVVRSHVFDRGRLRSPHRETNAPLLI